MEVNFSPAGYMGLMMMGMVGGLQIKLGGCLMLAAAVSGAQLGCDWERKNYLQKP